MPRKKLTRAQRAQRERAEADQQREERIARKLPWLLWGGIIGTVGSAAGILIAAFSPLTGSRNAAFVIFGLTAIVAVHLLNGAWHIRRHGIKRANALSKMSAREVLTGDLEQVIGKPPTQDRQSRQEKEPQV